MAGAAAAAVVSVGSSWHGEPRPLSPRKASTPRATTEGDRYQVLADTGSEPQTRAASPWMRVGGGRRPRPWAPALSALGIWIGGGTGTEARQLSHQLAGPWGDGHQLPALAAPRGVGMLALPGQVTSLLTTPSATRCTPTNPCSLKLLGTGFDLRRDSFLIRLCTQSFVPGFTALDCISRGRHIRG